MSTGLVLNARPDPQSQLCSLQQELFERNKQLSAAETRIADLEAELVRERAKSKQVERGAQKLRSVLLPWRDAIAMLFGEFDAMGVEAEAASVQSAYASGQASPKSAVWEDWKRKLSPREGKAIDALLLHGEMTIPQLRIHIGCASSTSREVAQLLVTKGLAVRTQRGKVALKEL